MKKLLLVFIIVLTLTACSSTTSEETAATVTEDSSEMEVEETSDAQVIEDNQEDESDLLMEVTNKRPDNLTVVSTTNSFGNQSQMITYYNGANIRYETDYGDMGKNIVIYLGDESIVYSYIEGQQDGTMMINVESYGEEAGLMVDTDELVSLVKEEANDGVIARKESLDGREVIYIETTSIDDDMSEVLIRMWYSNDYALPLKYEIEVDGEVMMDLNTDSVDESKIDPAMFIPASDVNFTEVDMSSMME